MISRVEYIWLDGTKPTQQLRSKTRIIQITETNNINLDIFPKWGFDGSSTYQSEGHSSDLVLKPVNFCKDPIRGTNNYLVMCEVFDADDKPHATNGRSILRKIKEQVEAEYEPWIGFEQEYTLLSGRTPLGWPANGYPEPQGPFYCGVGTDKVYGREISEEHARLCVEAGLTIFGTNAEVMPSQWEFQIGYRGFKGENYNILEYSDHLWFARWLLIRVAEKYGVGVSFDNKPVKGDWNGAGCHTNFSTKQMRAEGGYAAIEEAIEKLSKKHTEHIKIYGSGLNERLTGLHETCPIDSFKSGVSNRGASIRIPYHVKQDNCGYLEDRRPGANCCPYLVSARLLTTICSLKEDWFTKQFENVVSIKSKAKKS